MQRTSAVADAIISVRSVRPGGRRKRSDAEPQSANSPEGS